MKISTLGDLPHLPQGILTVLAHVCHDNKFPRESKIVAGGGGNASPQMNLVRLIIP